MPSRTVFGSPAGDTAAMLAAITVKRLNRMSFIPADLLLPA